ncbi:DUF3141 domain-containing protein [Inquilinus sp. Marseille-Q2685]|uniref:DUF3141 domain-containing protein n=1 Tax=Inquilinus sp. Marseille-Q2685 TaxID=2866581 RepID=UPI001CE3F5F2|nr:DUF3141 domain-containing protein [Inquilinus sp. Marseille-Q2685]
MTGTADQSAVLSAAWAEPWTSAVEYWVDAAQRSVLFWDVMRQRGNQYLAHAADPTPHVLSYQFELILDGRTLERPCNYMLVRIVPPEGVTVDPDKRPFVVVDPRAGHGPGIGGMKPESQIGRALRAGHPCYFIGFLPVPVAGQTLEDIGRAQAEFLRIVAERHPKAEGKPCVMGNCQAGWALAMLAAVKPGIVGPMILAGAPLSYWDGPRGKNPMRYLGGLAGGGWPAALASDMGNGRYDGAHLVQNFESLNPANTLWSKQYNLYSKIDTEVARYLSFEKWWGGYVQLNANEIETITEDLFVGDKLTAGQLEVSDGRKIDLRNITSPIVVFCSQGDNITPPQQALGWILDLYDSTDDIVANGQTIIYAIHDDIGHLGIFVSGRVAAKEHNEFIQNIDLIDTLAPGLYEAVIIEKQADDPNAGLIRGDHVVRFEARSINDLRALGINTAEEDKAFATAARVSEINRALYTSTARPLVQALASEPAAELGRRLSPARLQYSLFSNRNPAMLPVAMAAEQVRANRRPAAPDNPFLAFQDLMSSRIVTALDGWRDLRDRWIESSFYAIYGNPVLQAMLGIGDETLADRRPPRRSEPEEEREALRGKVAEGDVHAAVLRAILYVIWPMRAVDERGFATLRQLYADRLPGHWASLAEFKAAMRQQYLILRWLPEEAMAALPGLLPDDAATRDDAFAVIEAAASAAGPVTGEVKLRLDRMREAFAAAPTPAKPVRRGRTGRPLKVVK